MMEWNSLQRRRRPLRVMYCSQQWCRRRAGYARYVLNELADMPHASVMDMKMAQRAASPASPTARYQQQQLNGRY